MNTRPASVSVSVSVSVAVAVATAFLSLPAAAEDFSWKGAIARGGVLEIKGVNGGIEATAGSGTEAEVTAIKRARRSDPDEVEIKVVEHSGGVTICAVYPSRGGRANECQPGAGGDMSTRDNDTNVDFTVKVPAGARFVGRTVNGGIEATGLPGDAEAYTVNGGVRLEAAGLARAESVNGAIRASLGRADWTGELKLTTVNGGIRLDLPEGTNAVVKAETVNGSISTDFPLTVKGRFNRRHIEGQIGSGGRDLELETVNGSIDIKKRL
jgi:Putative adhesin